MNCVCAILGAQEIEFHKKEQEALRESNEALERVVDSLLRDPKTNVRLQMFPEFFPTRTKFLHGLLSVLQSCV